MTPRSLGRRLADHGMSSIDTNTFTVTPQTEVKRCEGCWMGAHAIDVVSNHPDLAAYAISYRSS
jgi:hypothetical protein